MSDPSKPSLADAIMIWANEFAAKHPEMRINVVSRGGQYESLHMTDGKYSIVPGLDFTFKDGNLTGLVVRHNLDHTTYADPNFFQMLEDVFK